MLKRIITYLEHLSFLPPGNFRKLNFGEKLKVCKLRKNTMLIKFLKKDAYLA